MSNETNDMQGMVDQQLAGLTITNTEVAVTDYRTTHQLKIAALATEADALPDITDKATLQANQDFLTKATRARTGIDKWRKAWKEPWKKIAEQVDDYLGTNRGSGLQAQIAAIEDKVEAKKKAYLDEQAKAQREADRLLEERYNERVGKLMAIGMAFEPNGNLTIRHGEETATATKEQIRFATDEQMAGAVQRAQIIAEKIADAIEAKRQAKEAQEREEAEERERLAQQRREQDAEQAKLKADREALEKQKAEMDEQRSTMRGDELVLLGAVKHGYGPALRYEIGSIVVGHSELATMTGGKWAGTRDAVRDAKVKAIEEQKERDRRNALVETRSMVLRDLGATHADGKWQLYDHDISEEAIAGYTSDEWAQCLDLFGQANLRSLGIATKAKEAAEARDNMGDRVLPIAGPGQHIKDGKVYFDAVCDESQPLQEGSAVVGAQPDHEQQAVAELLEEQHDIHEAINDLSIFADPNNWTEDDYGDPVIRDFGKLFDMTNAKDGWIEPWEIIARALKVLAIEKA